MANIIFQNLLQTKQRHSFNNLAKAIKKGIIKNLF